MSLADAIKAALLVLFGGGAGWVGPMIRDAIRGYRPKAERLQAKADKDTSTAIDITNQLRELAADAVADVRVEIGVLRGELSEERGKTSRLTTRVSQLERVIRDNHLEVPAEV